MNPFINPIIKNLLHDDTLGKADKINQVLSIQDTGLTIAQFHRWINKEKVVYITKPSKFNFDK